MRVILKSDVPNLGRAGDIKDVKNGYARNYLIPRGLVMSADARSEKERVFLDKVRERKVQKRKKTAEETAAAIKGKEVRITVKTGDHGKLFGSVTNLHIQKALEDEDILVDKKVIIVDEPIKELGEYNIALKFYEGIASDIRVIVQDEEGNTTPQVQEEPEPEEPLSEETASNEDSSEAEEATTAEEEKQPEV